MRIRWLTFLAGGLAAVALIAAACAPASEPEETTTGGGETTTKPPSGGDSGGTALPAGEEDAKFGGVLIVPMSAPPPSNSPWEEAVTRAMQIGHPQSNMIVQFQTWGDYVAKDYFNIVGDLATDWEQSSDGLQWTFRFHDGITFNDGQPFTCEDARWSLDTIRTGEGLRRSPRALAFPAVESIACADDLTMVITLKRAQPSILEAVALGPNMIWPKHVYEGEEGLTQLREDPVHVGTGPFMMTDWIAGEKYVFAKNPNYWKKPYPYLDGVEVRIVATSAIPPAVRAGRVHMGQTGSSFSGGQAEQLLKECGDCRFFPRFNHIGFTAITVNHQRPPWNTQDIKDAIGYAINQQKFVDVGNEGWGVPCVGIIHPDSPYALPRDLLDSVPGYNCSDPEGNMQKAREALARAGYAPGELTMNMPMWANVLTPRFPPVWEDLTEAGFNVVPEDLETARMYDLMTAGDFDMVPWGYFLTGSDPDITFYEHFYTGSDRNYGRYSNPEADRLIDLQSATLDPVERGKLLRQVSEIIMADQGKLVLAWYQYMPITGPLVRNFLPGPTCTSHGPCFRYERVWLSE